MSKSKLYLLKIKPGDSVTTCMSSAVIVSADVFISSVGGDSAVGGASDVVGRASLVVYGASPAVGGASPVVGVATSLGRVISAAGIDSAEGGTSVAVGGSIRGGEASNISSPGPDGLFFTSASGRSSSSAGGVSSNDSLKERIKH